MKGSVTVSNSDLKNSLDCLQQEVRKIKFPGTIDYQSLTKGAHSDLVAVLRHLFCDYSPALTGHLNRLGYELAGKEERRFLETVYLVMRDQLAHKPSITCAQFVSQSYPSRKAALVAEICRLGRELAARVRRPAVQRAVFDPQRLKRGTGTSAAANGGGIGSDPAEPVMLPASSVVDRPRSAGGNPPRAQVVREPRRPDTASCGASPRILGTGSGLQHQQPLHQQPQHGQVQHQQPLRQQPQHEQVQHQQPLRQQPQHEQVQHQQKPRTFPLASRYAMPVTSVLASEDEPPNLANRAVQTGPWAAEQRVAELANSLAHQVTEMAARLTLLEQRVCRIDGAAAPQPQQPQQHRQQQQPAAQQRQFSAAAPSGGGGRLVQGRLQSSDEFSASSAPPEFRRRPPVSPSPPPGARGRSREASVGEEAAKPSQAEAEAAAAAAAEMKQDLLGQARRIERLIAGTQSLLGSTGAPMLRASAE